jgi:glycosyltransferase involved in cell wall biosynthesis
MNILQVARSISTTGGIETFVRRLSDLLVTLGHTTTLVVTDDSSASPPCPTAVIKNLLLPPSPAHDAALGQLGTVLGSFQPDLVVTHHAAHGPLLEWLHARAPTVEILHGFVCQGGKLFRRQDTVCTHRVSRQCLWDWYIGPCGTSPAPSQAIGAYRSARAHLAALRRLRGVIVGSEFMREYALGEGLAPSDLWMADFDFTLPPERRLPGTLRRHSILFVGRLVYHKGVQYAVEALGQLGPEYNLTIVGDGWYRPALERLVGRRGLGGRIRFTGTLTGSALAAEYSQAGVLVVPSIWPEPVGLVVPEARGYGLPVAIFDAGGLPEWTSKYRGVYVARPADAGALADAIRSASLSTDAEAPAFAAARAARPIASLLELLARQRHE